MYLAIDKKGRVTELQDNTDTHGNHVTLMWPAVYGIAIITDNRTDRLCHCFDVVVLRGVGDFVYFCAALFMVFDRGMGVVSLRSWKHPGYWLRVVNGELMGKVRVSGCDDLNVM